MSSIWTLTDGATIFPISDGYSRIHQVLGKLGTALKQNTQVSTPMRNQWQRGFPERATTTLDFDLLVTFPPCATLDEAFQQQLDIPVQCPRGGVLTGLMGAELRTYAQAWRNSISVEAIGLTNQFTFRFTAVNPTTSILSPLAQMDPRYIANLNAITGLTGGGASKLDGQVTADVAVGFVGYIVATIADIEQPRFMRLITDPSPGVTVQNTDPTAGALIILPLDYNDTTNAKIWTEQ